ncbi:MAG TPA: SRPBCC family protein [Bacteroidia bacterium]|nr:SRPBCC family protein [Bacteroidia bacterium]
MIPINPKAPVQFRKTIIINANSVAVWKVLTDVANWSSWQTDLKSPVINGPVKEGAIFTWKSGGFKIKSELHTVSPYVHFGWTGKSLGVYAIHNFTITELKKQTEVLVEESMEGILTRILKPILKTKLEKTNTNWLNFLKRECERS